MESTLGARKSWVAPSKNTVAGAEVEMEGDNLLPCSISSAEYADTKAKASPNKNSLFISDFPKISSHDKLFCNILID